MGVALCVEDVVVFCVFLENDLQVVVSTYFPIYKEVPRAHCD